MPNTIQVTACDNELILLAYQGEGSYELCRILSGNEARVNVTLQILQGQYNGSVLLNGMQQGLEGTFQVYLEPGNYSLLLLGINWDGPTQFAVNVGTQTYSMPPQNAPEGLAWHPDPIGLLVV